VRRDRRDRRGGGWPPWTRRGLIRRSASATVIAFTPSAPLDEGDLNALPALASVEHKGGRITLSGSDETVNSVITLLARNSRNRGRVRRCRLAYRWYAMTHDAPTTDAAAPITLHIVDDQPVVRDGLRGVFESAPGFTVLGEAPDGVAALALTKALDPDVVLMDLRMPGGNGVEAIAEPTRRGARA
jgi:hypothetical protein